MAIKPDLFDGVVDTTEEKRNVGNKLYTALGSPRVSFKNSQGNAEVFWFVTRRA